MSKERRCIRITGTRTGKLRAQVERTLTDEAKKGLLRGDDGEIWFKHLPSGATRERFEVTIGGEKWKGLPFELREAIANRAEDYVNHLQEQLTPIVDEFCERFDDEENPSCPCS